MQRESTETQALKVVWVVTEWIFGGGGDDTTRVVAVCTTAERAYEIAGGEHDVAAFPLDEKVTRDAEPYDA